MEFLEDEVIFSQQFPDAQPTAMLRKAEELRHTIPADEMPSAPSFEDFMKQLEEKYTYELKPDAEKKSEQFIAQAIAVCRDFEIDTEILRRSHEIAVTMEMYCGWYDGYAIRAFASLLSLADDFNLSCVKDNPEYIRITMAYHTHAMYSRGEKVEWW